MGSISAINIKSRDVTRIEWYIKECGSVAQSLYVQTIARKLPRGSAHECLLIAGASEAACEVD